MKLNLFLFLISFIIFLKRNWLIHLPHTSRISYSLLGKHHLQLVIFIGRLNESIACIEQQLESNESAKNDIKQHETYIRTFINVGRHRNALSYLEGLTNDRAEWKEALDSYRVEACWKLGSWDKLKQVINANDQTGLKNVNTNNELLDPNDQLVNRLQSNSSIFLFL